MCVFERHFVNADKRKKECYLGTLKMETTKLLSRQPQISENFQANLQKKNQMQIY